VFVFFFDSWMPILGFFYIYLLVVFFVFFFGFFGGGIFVVGGGLGWVAGLCGGLDRHL
jgi:hypothetical protein